MWGLYHFPSIRNQMDCTNPSVVVIYILLSSKRRFDRHCKFFPFTTVERGIQYPQIQSRNQIPEHKEEHHGYSDTDSIFYVVYNHKRSLVGLLDNNVYIGPEFSVPYAKQMVSYSPRNLQRSHLLVPRIVQNRLSCFQCRSLRGVDDSEMKRRVQQSLALNGYSALMLR